MPASYPTAAKTFATITNATTSDAAQINEPREEITAIEQDLIAGLPIARGGTGLTAIGAANSIPQSNGSVLAYTASPTLSAVTAGTVTSTGQVVISGAAAGQIVFPAVQNASTNVNTLDDYEEGTWTPVIGGSGGQSGQAYTHQVGSYIKIGRQVTCWFDVLLSTLGTVTTNVQISGLPVASENVTNSHGGGAITFYSGMTSAVNAFYISVAPNTSVVAMNWAAGAATGSGAFLAQADLSNTTRFRGFVTYLAAA